MISDWIVTADGPVITDLRIGSAGAILGGVAIYGEFCNRSPGARLGVPVILPAPNPGER